MPSGCSPTCPSSSRRNRPTRGPAWPTACGARCRWSGRRPACAPRCGGSARPTRSSCGPRARPCAWTSWSTSTSGAVSPRPAACSPTTRISSRGTPTSARCAATSCPTGTRTGCCWNASGSARSSSTRWRRWPHRLRRLGRHWEAIEAAFAAIAEEPLRESAHAALIDTFLAERNVAQARHQLDRYAALLWSELAIKPSVELTNRVAAATGDHARAIDADEDERLTRRGR
jgi:Bacterial transcriptional activator domain